MFNLLLEKGSYRLKDLEIMDNKIPFLLVKTKNITLLSSAFDMGLQPRTMDIFGKMLIHEAIESGCTDTVDLILSKMETTQWDKTDFLCYSASHGNKDIINHLLDMDGYDVNLHHNDLNSTHNLGLYL